MRRTILCLLIAFVLSLSLTFVPAARAAEKDDNPRLVSTTGEATVYVTPDEVVLNLGVETYNSDLDSAKIANDQMAAKLVKAIKDMGVEEKHIQTADIEIEIRYKNWNKPDVGIEGYIARRAYAVTLRKVKDFEKLVDVALKNGANRLQGFEYRTSELRKHRDEARKMAIKAAREKAVALASELDCKAAAPRTITEGAFGYYSYWPRSWGNAYMAQNSVQHVGEAASAGETLPLGQIAIRASISVAFDLVPPAAVAGNGN
jgi:uncharacterized protein YggE